MNIVLTDYLPLLQKHITHWIEAEAQLSHSIVLEDHSTIDTLRDLHEAFYSARQTLLETENARQGAMRRRDKAREEALPTANQVRKHILGLIPGAEEAQQLPAQLPLATTNVQKQLAILRDVQHVWTLLNASPANKYPSLTTPLVVRVAINQTPRAVSLAEYTTALAALSQADEAIQVADQLLSQQRQARKVIEAQIGPLFRAYAKAIKGLFPDSSMVVQSLPPRR